MSLARFAVIGNPIAHSLSPEIHLAFAAETSRQLTYEKLLAEVDGFDATVSEFFDDQGAGLNVTAPFKGDAFNFVTERDSVAEAAGAVNTIAASNDGFIGYNTDGIGLVNDLKRLEWPISGSKVLVIGAGGAAQGIILPLLQNEAEITVANRTLTKAEALRVAFPKISVNSFNELTDGWDVVINATAAGWHQQGLAIQDRVFQHAHCYDLGYQRDGQTPFILKVEKSAASCSDGLGMLVEQAAAAFEIWHGIKPSTAPVLNGLRNPKRQFIAGAVCPRCGEQDTIYVERDLQGIVMLRVCKACGFSEDSEGNESLRLD